MLAPDQIDSIKRTLPQESPFSTVFQALGDPRRLEIFYLLVRFQDICVTDVAHILEISVPAASHHLRFLELAGIVKRLKMGQTVCYEIEKDKEPIRQIARLVGQPL